MSKDFDLRLFGLIGYPLGHSFSRSYFSEKFQREGLGNCRYELFPIPTIEDLPALIDSHPGLEGLNVTIPYKTAILPYLTYAGPEIREIGAVNTVLIREGERLGFNTDVWGFRESLTGFLPAGFDSLALILGTGGASKAVQHVLGKMGIGFTLVSRAPGPGMLDYGGVDEAVLAAHRLIVQTTPLGMAPDTGNCPSFPFHFLSGNHYLYDLIYNPAETLFMECGKRRGCKVKNGLEMLYLQADKAWEIWNTPIQDLTKHLPV